MQCRYNTPTNIFKAPNGVTGSSSILENSTEVAKRESVGDIQLYSADQAVNQSSNGVSNNIDMGSTTNNLPKDKSKATSTVNGLHASAFRHVKNDIRYMQQQVGLMPNGGHSTDLCRGSYQDLQIQHPHHKNYHHHHSFHVENQPSPNHNESSLRKLAVDAPLCGSTNVLGGPMDGAPMNCSLNDRSASGSNHGSNNGSNGQNGSSAAVNAVGNNGESDVGQAGKSGSGSGSGSGNENRFAQREAALLKFRQKKKERCFKKKVLSLISIIDSSKFSWLMARRM